jgi:hypothetical protein
MKYVLFRRLKISKHKFDPSEHFWAITFERHLSFYFSMDRQINLHTL